MIQHFKARYNTSKVRYSLQKYDTALHKKVQEFKVLYSTCKSDTVLQIKIECFILKYSTYKHYKALPNIIQNFQAYSNLNDYTEIQRKTVRYNPSEYDTALHTRIQRLEVLCSASK